MAEQVKQDTCVPPHQKLKQSIEAKLEALLKEYASQFMQDEISIGTTPLTEMMIDTGTSEPVVQKPYPFNMKHYQGWNREATYSKSHMRKQINLVSGHHSSTKRRWRKMLSGWLLHTQ